MAPIDRASGKILGKSQRWTAVNRDWGNTQRGCSVRYKERNYTTNPLSPLEQAHRQAFMDASELRKKILNTSSLRQTWMAKFREAKNDGSTNCATLNGYLMQTAMNGGIDEDGNFVG